jgi:hypothetical protein
VDRADRRSRVTPAGRACVHVVHNHLVGGGRGDLGPMVRRFSRRARGVGVALALSVGVAAGFASAAQRSATAHAAAAPPTFELDTALTEVGNPNANELTITPTSAGLAIDDHTGANGGAGNGGDWKVEYHWAVPTRLVPGKTAAIYLQIIVDSEDPPQPNGYQMGALAPDFAQSLPCHYPEQSSCSKTFEYRLAADQAGAKDIPISIHMLSAEVDFDYRPLSASGPTETFLVVFAPHHGGISGRLQFKTVGVKDRHRGYEVEPTYIGGSSEPLTITRGIFGQHSLGLEVVSGRYQPPTTNGPSPTAPLLELQVRVSSSSDRSCPPGSQGELLAYGAVGGRGTHGTVIKLCGETIDEPSEGVHLQQLP